MVRAWEIAREGVKKFGGKVREYFAQALAMAWQEIKKGVEIMEKVKGTISKISFPELKGTEKQIKWAKSIRANAAAVLQDELMNEEYEVVNELPGRKNTIEKRRVDAIVKALFSEQGVKNYLDKLKNSNVPESRIESAVVSMNKAYDRFVRLSEIMSNADAKFWIDNRDNQEKNYMFKKFKNYVSNGVKEF